MTDTAAEILVAVLAFLLAGLVKGVIGMGLPTVAVGVLSLVTTPAKAAAILVIPSLVTNVWQVWAGRRLGSILRRLWPLLLGTCAGTAAGALLFAPGSMRGGDVALGVALILYAALGLASVPIHVRRCDEPWLGPLSGFATGVLTVVTNTFVLPSVPYLGALAWDHDELVQALGVSFMVSTLALAAALLGQGVLAPAAAGVSVLAVLPAVAGMSIGQALRRRVSPRAFRVCFFLGLLGLGVHLVSRGVL